MADQSNLSFPLSVYANNVQLESSDFDLRIIFGEQVQNSQNNTVALRQIVGVRLSWLEAKLLSHFLRATLTGYEMTNGEVKVPDGARPAAPPPLPDALKDDPKAIKIYEALLRIHNEFIGGLK